MFQNPVVVSSPAKQSQPSQYLQQPQLPPALQTPPGQPQHQHQQASVSSLSLLIRDRLKFECVCGWCVCSPQPLRLETSEDNKTELQAQKAVPKIRELKTKAQAIASSRVVVHEGLPPTDLCPFIRTLDLW